MCWLPKVCVLQETNYPKQHHIKEENCGNLALVDLLKTCAKEKNLCLGTILHADILKTGVLEKNPFVASALINMYVKCGSLAKAKEVLDGLPIRNAVLWNVLITGYAQAGHGKEALKCFQEMQCEGHLPGAVTFACILRACGCNKALEDGQKLHKEIVMQGLLAENVILGGALVDMYVKCGAFIQAKEVLDDLHIRNAATWNALIAGYAQRGHDKDTLDCFECMKHEGIIPDAVTFTCILRVCTNSGAFDRGIKAHSEIVRLGLSDGNVVLGNALVDMYAKVGTTAQAKEVLDNLSVRDVISWSAIIAGYAQGDHGKEALECFSQMQCEGLLANDVTFICVLRACGSVGALDKGEKIHAEIVRQGLLGGNAVLGGAVVDMYVKCGALAKAKEVLEGLSMRTAISWNALIVGYAQDLHGMEALNCSEQMQREGYFPDATTFAAILSSCSIIGALDKGEKVHSEIVRQGLLGGDVILGNALVDMYAKCGALANAKESLDELLVQNVATWNALIAGFAQWEQGKEALDSFERMQQEGFSPDEITFVCVLTACSHSGLLVEGQNYFTYMCKSYRIQPSEEHHTCVIGLFCRAGFFDKAMAVFKKMTHSDHENPAAWSALLGACQNLGNLKLGKWAFELMLLLDERSHQAF